MTISVEFGDDELAANPLDLVEQFVIANDWPFDRRNDEEMAVEVPGRWCDFSLYFAWREELGAMHFTCAYDMKIPDAKRPPIYELLALVNDRMWLGHFGIWAEENIPMFRHSVLLRGASGASMEQIEDLVDIALSEAERFYPAFQFVIWGGKTANEAIAAALLDTVGEA
ncbi:YbjN domain-containing protein [Telmatospirillum sp. J64-1]|uniref:YbjN domain-containing protein n=1 Tax=Telmatospirillum sp. J64-1 TaxID=2502183 RepID=UPI00115CFC8F|nr:YbjN domain-containing protein [Telmatospirillum sp. J64-1]